MNYLLKCIKQQIYRLISCILIQNIFILTIVFYDCKIIKKILLKYTFFINNPFAIRSTDLNQIGGIKIG